MAMRIGDILSEWLQASLLAAAASNVMRRPPRPAADQAGEGRKGPDRGWLDPGLLKAVESLTETMRRLAGGLGEARSDGGLLGQLFGGGRGGGAPWGKAGDAALKAARLARGVRGAGRGAAEAGAAEAGAAEAGAAEAGAAEGGTAAAGAAAAGGPPGWVVGAIIAAALAAVYLAKKMNELAKQTVQANLQLAQYGGRLSAAAAQAELAQTQMNYQMARRTGTTGAAVLRAQTAYEREWLPIKSVLQNLKNALSLHTITLKRSALWLFKNTTALGQLVMWLDKLGSRGDAAGLQNFFNDMAFGRWPKRANPGPRPKENPWTPEQLQ